MLWRHRDALSSRAQRASPGECGCWRDAQSVRVAALEMGLDPFSQLRRVASTSNKATGMGRIDWDKGQRRERVVRNGAEPSEYRPDLTEQIAISKASSKVRGVMYRRCGARGKDFSEADFPGHPCFARPHARKVKCPVCRKDVYADIFKQHLRWHQNNRLRQRQTKPKPKVQCKICGLRIKVTRFKKHMKHHGKRSS